MEKVNILKILIFALALSALFGGPLDSVKAAPDGCSDVSGWNCQEWEGLTKYTCPNDYVYSRVDFATVANTVRGYTAPSGNWGPNCTVGCNDFSACGDCECRCYGNDLYCADRWLLSDGTHVAQSCSFNATSLNDYRCVSTAYFAAPTVVNGSCGTRNTTYAATVTTWPEGSTWCSSGTASTAVSFPAVGTTSNPWTCIHGAVSATGNVSEVSNPLIPDSFTTAWRWVIRTTANDAAGIFTSDIIYNTESFSTSTLAPNTYKVYLAVQRRGVWSGWVSRQITVSNASCSASRSYYTCGSSIPTNASAYDAEESSSVTTASNWAYAATDSATKCQYKCNANYYWNGSSCVAYACGSANGTSVSTQPTTNLCNSGAAVWTDTTAIDGAYNWTCGVASCSATKVAVVNGACGTKRGTFIATTTAADWNALTYCVPNNPQSTPDFPANGSSVSWGCNGSGGGTNTAADACTAIHLAYQCSEPPSAPNGTTTIACSSSENSGLSGTESWHSVGALASDCNSDTRKCRFYTPAGCGSANKTYAYNDTGYGSDTFCDSFTLSPAPPFPANPGERVTWSCGGAVDQCAATRQRNLNWEETSPSN